MISIITSTYKRPGKLKLAIKSVLEQTYQDWEMIIVADGPQDDEVRQSVPDDPRFRYIELPENFGNDTRPKNVGIREAHGEYIAFLDDDVQYRPDHLAALIAGIGDNDIAYGDRMVYHNNVLLGPGISSDYDPFLLLRRNYIDVNDVLIKTSSMKWLGGFDERYKKFVDWNVWVRASKAGMRFVHIPKMLTDYYLDDTSKSFRAEDTQADGTFGKPKWDPFDCEIQLDYLGLVPQPRVAIYSLTYDRLELTEKCFKSMYETAGHPFTHIIVDNGSKDGTVEYLQQLTPYEDCKEICVVYNDDNKGISIASNQAITTIKEYGQFDIIMKVDNDAFFHTKDWLNAMVEIWKRNRRVALSCYIKGLRDNPGGAPREVYGFLNKELVGMTRHLGGICHFVDAKGYDGFSWDEGSNLHGVQDLEFSQWLNHKGFQMGYLENYYCEHLYGTAGQHEKFPEYFERRKFEKTHAYGENK